MWNPIPALFVVIGAAVAIDAATLSGTVTRADTGGPVSGVRVTVAGTALATLTDEAGAFVLEVPPTRC